MSLLFLKLRVDQLKVRASLSIPVNLLSLLLFLSSCAFPALSCSTPLRVCAADRCFPHIRVYALTILGSMTCPQNKCHHPSYSSRTTPYAVLFVCPLYCPMAIELRTVPAPRMRSIRLSHRNIFHSPLSDVFVYCILLLPSLQAPCILSYLISTYLGL